ncbi:hypothetical protein P154DRAFT_50558 [Amniculicola lignicola CBS 123094]|uniref:Uncharacterized protein n=1 Tax=Amniculicola lignicola CBS 123094 TaxID=1392246 RepID=A0A6A5WRL5_9PLEO|nr:hypothetical protein P154DRAFT_50558 [Amniculicola lignicola CBS 123094]
MHQLPRPACNIHECVSMGMWFGVLTIRGLPFWSHQRHPQHHLLMHPSSLDRPFAVHWDLSSHIAGPAARTGSGHLGLEDIGSAGMRPAGETGSKAPVRGTAVDHIGCHGCQRWFETGECLVKGVLPFPLLRVGVTIWLGLAVLEAALRRWSILLVIRLLAVISLCSIGLLLLLLLLLLLWGVGARLVVALRGVLVVSLGGIVALSLAGSGRPVLGVRRVLLLAVLAILAIVWV